MKVITLGTEAKEKIEEKIQIVKKICDCKNNDKLFNELLRENKNLDTTKLINLYEFINRVFNYEYLKEEDYSFLAALFNDELSECILNEKVRIVATAGNLSRTEGKVTQVFEKKTNYEKNINFASKVISYGHKTISEHDYIVLALEDVTPIVEQTIIGYRLTSFTIKSRRNVDFRNVGFYIPNFKDNNGNVLDNNKQLQNIYQDYMKSLFEKYGSLVDEGLPIEDCRYILPYCYFSNIVMGCDANELFRITSDMLYGKLSKIDELRQFGEKLKEVLHKNAPYLDEELEKEKDKDYYQDKFAFLDEYYNMYNNKECELIKTPKLINHTPYPDINVIYSIMMSRYQISREKASDLLYRISQSSNLLIKIEMMQALLQSKNQRELEQIHFSFEASISLAALTHITRHRMQSLLVPDFVPLWNMKNYITPNTIAEVYGEEYNEVFNKNYLMVQKFKKFGVRDEDLVYFYLSGNACNIYTTMNGKSMVWFSRMRCCNKAQWEIKNIADSIVDEIKYVSPLVNSLMGPTCKVLGYCPEGKDSCKEREIVTKKLIKK